ncbi:MAG: hypothetical protein LUD72_03090 [Bacteroidales bacterium]|nr:hypothetical protein [Bacteroidales bacterium]
MTDNKYPYLGKCSIGERSVTVLFNAERQGMVVQSDIADDERFAFARYGEFDETYFAPLPDNMCVRINNSLNTPPANG